MIDGTQISCGVSQMYSLYDLNPKEIIANDWEEMWSWDDNDVWNLNIAFILFSDVASSGNGQRLAAYIKKNGLGTVTSSRAVKNPNSGNLIKVWTWTLSKKGMTAYGKKNRLPRGCD